jgi:AraC-like DNA-binding protein
MTVITGAGAWVVPPGQALWIPAGEEHQSRCCGVVRLRTLYISPYAADLPKRSRLLEVSPLLSALLDEAMTFAVDYDEGGREGQVMDLILSEVARLPEVPPNLPAPRDPRLARICEVVMSDLSRDHDLEELSRLGGLARRTLTRRFRQETGMSFAAWRQQIRLCEGLARLTAGEQVTTVALDLGYDSPSAFTAMFRRALGAAPRDYLRWSGEERAIL